MSFVQLAGNRIGQNGGEVGALGSMLTRVSNTVLLYEYLDLVMAVAIVSYFVGNLSLFNIGTFIRILAG